MGLIRKTVDWLVGLARPSWRNVEWRRRTGPPSVPTKREGSCDTVDVRLEDLVMSLTRVTSSTLPHEVTVVIPRAEITKKYEDGRLVETSLVYSSITVSHAPRFTPRN